MVGGFHISSTPTPSSKAMNLGGYPLDIKTKHASFAVLATDWADLSEGNPQTLARLGNLVYTRKVYPGIYQGGRVPDEKGMLNRAQRLAAGCWIVMLMALDVRQVYSMLSS